MLVACAGVTEYKVTTPDGVTVEAKNTKDYESYDLNVKREADGSYSMQLKERGVSASTPLKASQEMNSQLLDKLIGVITP